MKKNDITTMQVRQMSTLFDQSWETYKNEVKVKGSSALNLIRLKKTLTEEAELIQEAIIQHAEAIGGSWQDGGAMKVPDDKIGEMNEWLTEFGKEGRTISYTPIIIGNNDSVPIGLMEIIMDFIEVED